MGKVFKDKQGNVITKLLQFVATDAQVNQAITDYLDKNGITLAEGVDLKRMSSDLSKTLSDVDGIKEAMSDLQQAQTNVLLQYKDHFIDTFEAGYIDDKTGTDTEVAGYIRSVGLQKIQTQNSVLIVNAPTGYQYAWYFYDENQKYQGATQWMTKTDAYRITDSQVGWYVRCVMYSSGTLSIDAIDIILAGSAVTDILDQLMEQQGSSELLGEEVLSSADKLELNVTKASLQSVCDVNCIVIPFLTDLHITCTAGKTPEELAEGATKIRRHIACYNLLTGGIDVSPKRHVAGMTRKTPC